MTTGDALLFHSYPLFLQTSKFKCTSCFYTDWFHFRHDFDSQLLVGEKRERATEQGHKYCKNEMTEHLREALRRFGSISRAAVFWPTRLSTMMIKKKGISLANELKPNKFSLNKAEKKSGKM